MHSDFLQGESSGGLHGLVCKLQEPMRRGTKKVPLGFKEEVSLKRGSPWKSSLVAAEQRGCPSPPYRRRNANTTEFLKVHRRLG